MAIKLTDAKKQQLIDAAKKYWVDAVTNQLKDAWYTYDSKTWLLNQKESTQTTNNPVDTSTIETTQNNTTTTNAKPNVTDTQKKMLVDSARKNWVDATVNQLKDAWVTYNKETWLNIPKQDDTTTKPITPEIDTRLDIIRDKPPYEIQETPWVKYEQPAWYTEDWVDLSKIWTVEEWKQKTWWWLSNLETWVESRYGTTATQQDWKLIANINWQNYEWTLDEAWNPIKKLITWPLDIYNNLLLWIWVDKNDPSYPQAKARYDIYSKYNWMTEQQFYDALVNWNIWSQLDKDLSQNPAYIAAKQNYNNKIKTDLINNENKSVYNVYSWNTLPTGDKVDMNTKLLKFFESFNDVPDIWTFKSFLDTNYPDLTDKVSELNKKQVQLRELADIRDDRLKTILKEHKWISLNTATMLAARENQDINDQIRSLSYEVSALWADVNYETDLAKTDYDYLTKQQARQDALQSEMRWYYFDLLKTEEWRAYEQQMIQDQRDYEAKNNIPTTIITDEATWNQMLINTQTWEVIKTYDTWLQTSSTSLKDEWTKLNEKQLFNKRTWEIKDLTTWETTWYDFTWVNYSPIELIKQFEWFRNVTYDDKTWWVLSSWMTAQWTPTIWYWFTNVAYRPVTPWMQILQNWDILDINWNKISTVDEELQRQVENHSNYKTKINVPLTDNQKAALASFEYNLWPNIWNWDWRNIIDMINKWNLEWAANEIKKYTYSKWEFMQWLANRRNMEAQLLLSKWTADTWWSKWSLWIPINYERQIKSMVPTQLMNSEVELEQLNNTIKSLYKSWMSSEQAVLTYLWFDVWLINEDKAKEYINIWRNLWDSMPESFISIISNHLNNWDYNNAEKYVSNIISDAAKKRFWEDFIPTSSINQLTKDNNTLANLIRRNPDKIWAFDWRVNDFLRKFKDYPEMQTLQTLLTMDQAWIRKHFAWSAITDSEMSALVDYIGWNTKMTPWNLLTMLNTIRDRTESLYLEQRKEFWYTPAVRDEKWNLINQNDPLNLWF